MPHAGSPGRDRRSRLYAGYTLVEILVATTLSLLLLGAVVRMFGDVGQGITDSRAMLESADRLRVAQTRLQQDLAGVTVTMSPPRKPENNEGYFEYIEGPVGPTPAAQPQAWNTDTGSVDTTVGDFDDILMFTTRSTGRPFVGRCGVTTIQSDVAEVAWFVRGKTLHRRVLLVAPTVDVSAAGTNLYRDYDISASVQNGRLVANTLGDLTKRECRFAHPHWSSPAPNDWPFNARVWIQLKLPTLRECSAAWNLVSPPYSAMPARKASVDFWANGTSKSNTDTLPWADDILLTGGTRIADDVILTNVIGFDVKAWDPTANVGLGAYVDLGYNNVNYTAALATGLSHLGNPLSKLDASPSGARVYDTFSTHYENAGRGPGDTLAGRSTNGFDDIGNLGTANGIVDDADELLTAPPYPIPLRGIQVKIRVFEPDSRQVREVTVVQDFLSQ
jgi:type II secretory pathway component PulJ